MDMQKKKRMNFYYGILGVTILAIGFWFLVPARADTLTVCASGCSQTTIGNAINSAFASDTISLTEDYAFGDAEGVVFTKALTLDCGGYKIWGNNTADNWLFIDSENVTINDCVIEYDADKNGTAVYPTECTSSSYNAIRDEAGGSTITNSTITNFLNPIYLDSPVAYTVSGNTINSCLTGVQTQYAGTISGNTIAGQGAGFGVKLLPSGGTGTLTVSGNTITSNSTGDDWVGIGSEAMSSMDIVISGNTIKPATGKVLYRGINFEGGSSAGTGSVIITDNIIYDWKETLGIAINLANGTVFQHPSVTIVNNTLYQSSSSEPWAATISLSAASTATKILSLDIRNNLIYGGKYGIDFSNQNSTNLPSVTLDYNSYYNIYESTLGGAFASVGSNSMTVNQYLTDASAYDFSLKGFSRLVGSASDSGDIGAEDYVGSRDTTINVPADISDPGVAITYATDSDTVEIAAGTQTQATLGVLSASNATIQGAGETSILNLTTGGSGITVTGDSNSINDINIQSVDNAYTITNTLYSYGGNNYDTDGDNEGMFITDAVTCDATDLNADGIDITDELNDENVNLVLADMGVDDGYSVVWVNDSDVSDQAEATALIVTACGGTSGVFIGDVFTYSSGTYTYESATIAAASVTLMSGYTDPPAITTSTSAAIKITGDSNIVESITTASITGYGMIFSGTSASNTLDTDSTIVSTLDQLYSDSSGTNSILAYTDTYTSSGSGTLTWTLGTDPSAVPPTRRTILTDSTPPVVIEPEVPVEEAETVDPTEEEVVDEEVTVPEEEIVDEEEVVVPEEEVEDIVDVTPEIATPELPEVRNTELEVDAINKFIEKENRLPEGSDWKVVQFIAYGSTNITANLSSFERTSLVKDYKAIYGENPKTEEAWKIVDGIATGEKPEKVINVETKAIEEFVNIYKRLVDFTVSEEENFIHTVAYRLRIVDRDVEKEKKALNVFTSVYNKLPSSSHMWSVLRAIAYSGVK